MVNAIRRRHANQHCLIVSKLVSHKSVIRWILGELVSVDIYKQLNKRLNTPDTSTYFVSDNSSVCNLNGILNLLLGEITLCGTDASARRREMR